MRKKHQRTHTVKIGAAVIGALALLVTAYVLFFWNVVGFERGTADAEATDGGGKPVARLDTAEYDRRMLALANLGTTTAATSSATSTAVRLWPVSDAPYPNAGAILPFKRVLAYYGNFYSKGMGILGEYPEDTVIEKLLAEKARWEAADPDTPVVPAIEYIAVTAQESPIDGTYRARMPLDQIDRALAMAEKVDGIVILDVQVGLSTLQKEVPLLEEYLKRPNVHLAIDPEFMMHGGARPGTVIGSASAADVNYAAEYLAGLVRTYDLPPKILIVHRFTQDMVTGYRAIAPLPEVQVVMVMDGWGSPAKKFGTYQHVIYPEPVQFTGFKIFYKNDMRPPSTRLVTPGDVLNLSPRPIFIQYQ